MLGGIIRHSELYFKSCLSLIMDSIKSSEPADWCWSAREEISIQWTAQPLVYCLFAFALWICNHIWCTMHPITVSKGRSLCQYKIRWRVCTENVLGNAVITSVVSCLRRRQKLFLIWLFLKPCVMTVKWGFSFICRNGWQGFRWTAPRSKFKLSPPSHKKHVLDTSFLSEQWTAVLFILHCLQPEDMAPDTGIKREWITLWICLRTWKMAVHFFPPGTYSSSDCNPRTVAPAIFLYANVILLFPHLCLCLSLI